MRFYTLLLTLMFILTSQLSAHTFDSEIITPEQIKLIQAEGITGAQSVIADLDASEFLNDSQTVKEVVTEIIDLLAENDSSDTAIVEISQAIAESILLLSNKVSLDLNADGASDSTDISLLLGATAEGITTGYIHRFIETSGDVNRDGRIDGKDISPTISEGILKGLTQAISTTAPKLSVATPNTLLSFAAEQGVDKGVKDIVNHVRMHNEPPALKHPRIDTLNDDPTIVSPVG